MVRRDMEKSANEDLSMLQTHNHSNLNQYTESDISAGGPPPQPELNMSEAFSLHPG